MRLTLLHNPTAGDGDWDRPALEAALDGHDVTYQSVKEDGWARALTAPTELLVVAGGDGTVRKVCTALGPTPTLVALVPTGSANNIATALGVSPDDPTVLLGTLDTADRRPFDVWEVALGDGSNRRFVEVFGGGLLADVFLRAEHGSSPDGEHKVDHGLKLVRAQLEDAAPAEWQLLAGGRIHERELLGVACLNVGRVGPRLRLSGDSNPSDGLLEVVLLEPDDREDLLAYVQAREDERPAPIPAPAVLRTRALTLVAPAGVALHADDDTIPGAPVRRRLDLHRADVHVEVLVPA